MDLSGILGELKLTVQVTRADTGETEEVEMVGTLTEQDEEPKKED